MDEMIKSKMLNFLGGLEHYFTIEKQGALKVQVE